MKIPQTVKVGHMTYSIEPWTPGPTENGAYGCCITGNAQILIDFNKPVSAIKDTLLHEIMHAVYYWFSVQEGDDEEQIVSKMATGLTCVLTDNPKVAKFLTK